MHKSFLKKVGLIFCFGVFLILLDSCYALSCACPSGVKEFFDFQSTSTQILRDTVTAGRRFEMVLILEDKEFLVEAETTSCHRPWFINSAFACSCIEEGERGLKFPVTDIRIFSNADYSEDIRAGELLNGLVKVGEQEETLLNVGNKDKFFNTYFDVQLAIDTSPSLDSTHIFTIEVEKENGTIISAETEAVTWY